MIARLGKYYIFYRHFLYGSALAISYLITTFGFNHSGMFNVALLVAGLLLMLSSIIVSTTINRFPEQFKEEIKELNKLDV